MVVKSKEASKESNNGFKPDYYSAYVRFRNQKEYRFIRHFPRLAGETERTGPMKLMRVLKKQYSRRDIGNISHTFSPNMVSELELDNMKIVVVKKQETRDEETCLFT